MTDMNENQASGTELVTTRQTKSVLNDMADRYGMEPGPFEATVRAICMPATHTREQFAAFLLVAKEYRLNPLTKEIYAFPAKGGGIIPVVSIDGWISLVNSHPSCDGFNFSWEQDADGAPISCTCTMYRKDRSHPVIVTEYYAECVRPTDPWKMKHRMLRHKAMIQAARYAFGFSGIYDEDEGERIAEARNITPSRMTPPTPPEPPEEAEVIDQTEEPVTDHAAFLLNIGETLSAAKNADEVEQFFDELDVQSILSGDEAALSQAFTIKNNYLDLVERTAQTLFDDLPEDTKQAVKLAGTP